MFSGTFSLLPGGGGSGGSVSLLPGGGGGGGTVSLLPSSGGSTGTITLLPSYSYSAPVQPYAYSYPSAAYYSYSAPGSSYALPGAGMQAGPFGERGPYTPLEFPLMRELLPGERLDQLNPQTGFARGSALPYLALGVIAALLLKG